MTGEFASFSAQSSSYLVRILRLISHAKVLTYTERLCCDILSTDTVQSGPWLSEIWKKTLHLEVSRDPEYTERTLPFIGSSQTQLQQQRHLIDLASISECQVTECVCSGARLAKNVSASQSALEFIVALQPRSLAKSASELYQCNLFIC